MKIKEPKPSLIFAAFNPAILEIELAAGEDIEDIYVTLTATTIKGYKTVILRRDFINGKATFDLSGFIRKSFVDDQDELTNYPGFFLDNNLMITYDYVVGDGIYMNGGYAINAVKQLGESSDLTSERGTFRTNFERLRVYEGYPHTLSVLGFNGGTYVNFENESTQKIGSILFTFPITPAEKNVSISTESKFPELVSNLGEVLTDNDGNVLYVEDGDFKGLYKYIDTCCVPENPFYVRWINQQGGWDYWMFSFRQSVSRNIENQEFYYPAIFNQETAAAAAGVYYKQGIETIRVGAGGLNANEYECISKLVYSPRIDYYDKEKDKWLRLIIENGENLNDTRSPEKEVEFTFVLPAPQLQI